MAGYTRQDTANNIANGNVIDADDFDAEYNQLESAFNASTGHVHDGTSGNGAPIEKVGPSQDLVITATKVEPKTTNTLDLGSSAVQFKNAFFDGTVDTDTLTVSGNGTVGGTLGVTGLLTATGGVSGAVTGNVTGTVSDVSNHDTNDISEGSTNLYFTTQRARDSVSATGSLGYDSSTGVMSFTQGNTDTVAEGTTNLYYTTLRAQTDAKTAISVADSGGDGSLTYNAGVITYTGPSATETRAHFTAGTGVTYSGGQFSIGQTVNTDSNVTFNNAIVSGDLTVSGTTTYINTQTLNIGDNIITLNADLTGTPSVDGGIEVERGGEPNKSFVWDESEDEWSVGSERIKAGTFEGAVTGNVTGNADTATKLQTARTIDITGDITATAVSFDGSANIAISASVNNNSHSHTIANVTGLQTEIDTKAELAGSTGQAFSASTVNATTVDLGAWTVTQSGTDLKFAYNGTNRMKLDSSGNLTVEGNVTAYGSA